jgi:OOP family OmpA-OmpF porin
MKPTLRLCTLASLGTLMAAPVLAQDNYLYGGFSVGQSRAEFDDPRIAGAVAGPGISVSSLTRDDRDNGYKLFGGYQINRYFGVEAGFFDLGKFSFNATTTPSGTVNGRLKVQGGTFDLVGTLPLSENFSAIGRAGFTYAKTRDTFSGSGAAVVTNTTPSKREADPKLGIGLQYAFSPSFIMRGEAEGYRINDAVGHRSTVHQFSVSLVFPFGRSAQTARPMAMNTYVPPPAPEAPPAPPPQAPLVVLVAPMAAPAPAPVVLQRVSFSAESLFGFDHAEMRADGKAALDKFAADLRGTQYSSITVEGHTDRLGSTAYNQKLSEERAESVKAYLVTSGGLDPAKITAVGKSESVPVTKPEDCKGMQETPALVACLQPDRRVEVEVTGSR